MVSREQIQDFPWMGCKLEHLWRSPQLISAKVNLFYTTCVTILLYGCESWVLSQDVESKINSFATSCYRIMLDIMREDRISSTIIHTMTNTKPLVHCVRKYQLGFLGHILRLPEEEPARRYALYIPSHGKKETWTSTNLLPCLHSMCVRVWWKGDGSRRNSHPCQRSMCLEKACNCLLRSQRRRRRMMMMMMMMMMTTMGANTS